MKVKELIKWLHKQDPEAFVGLLQIGQDTGDWFDLQDNNSYGHNCLDELKILSYDEAIKKMKEDDQTYQIEKFKKKYPKVEK